MSDNSLRTRKNVATLGNPDDDLDWYARAVAALQSRAVTDPTSWRYQAAVHGYDQSSDPNAQPGEPFPSNTEQQRFWRQCQHQTWYFLPWHRAYLACFEQIVAAAVVKLGGPPDWALPYWNYSGDRNARLLPSAFVNPQLADGSTNPLWVDGRNSSTADFEIADADVSLIALTDSRFTGLAPGGDPGFGGPKTLFSHSGRINGRFENVPHNAIHGDIGGLMNDPDTAALDPIFWLHHCNIDRLWEVWRHRGAGFLNPTDPAWLNLSFEFRDASGNIAAFTPSQVVDTTKLLHGFRYDDLSDPFAAPVHAAPQAAMAAVTPEPQVQPELVAATAQPVVLDSSEKTAHVAFHSQAAHAVRARLGAAARPLRTYLNLENVTGAGRLGMYDVYVDVPPAGQDSSDRPPLFAGLLSTFGVQKASRRDSPHGGSGITTVIDITDLVEQLRREGRWDEQRLHVTFKRRAPARKALPATSNLQVGRVSVYYH
jgi:tyrosinase